MEAARIPVIVGVGQVNDRGSTLDSGGLMEAALLAADGDAGGGWLAELDQLSVVRQISFPALGDCSGALAAALGARPRMCETTPSPHGDYPVRLLNEAANRVGAGEIRVAAIVGGEALRTAMAGAGGRGAMAEAAAKVAPSLAARFGLVAPVEVYPLYENACRAAYGQTLGEAQAETGQIWAEMARVAAENEGAWLRTPMTAAEICTLSADNRPIAHPYLKRMVANSAVNQGAGFIVTSLAHARARGVAEDRMVHVGYGAAAKEPDDFLARDRYDRSAAMAASIEGCMAMNGIAVADLDLVELYSCFPCVPKMARRVLAWPAGRPATVFGGLTFGGGPIGNYMSHAIVDMVRRLRAGGLRGLLFANGGFATHNHTLLLSSAPTGAVFPQDFDVQAAADAARGPVPAVIEDYIGPGTIDTFTVLYGRDGQARLGVVVGRAPGGERFLARVPPSDAEGIGFLTDGEREPVGSEGWVDSAAVWRRKKEGLLF